MFSFKIVNSAQNTIPLWFLVTVPQNTIIFASCHKKADFRRFCIPVKTGYIVLRTCLKKLQFSLYNTKNPGKNRKTIRLSKLCFLHVSWSDNDLKKKNRFFKVSVASESRFEKIHMSDWFWKKKKHNYIFSQNCNFWPLNFCNQNLTWFSENMTDFTSISEISVI